MQHLHAPSYLIARPSSQQSSTTGKSGHITSEDHSEVFLNPSTIQLRFLGICFRFSSPTSKVVLVFELRKPYYSRLYRPSRLIASTKKWPWLWHNKPSMWPPRLWCWLRRQRTWKYHIGLITYHNSKSRDSDIWHMRSLISTVLDFCMKFGYLFKRKHNATFSIVFFAGRQSQFDTLRLSGD